MATIADKLVYMNETKLDYHREAIIDMGSPVPMDTPHRKYADKIRAIPQEGDGGITPGDGEWVRPSDRPTAPTLNEEEIYMLFGVQSTGPNDYAITLTASGGYTVDWGDGTVEDIASAIKCEHMYDYSTLAVTPNDIGIKWVWIKFTPTLATSYFTVINHKVRHSLRPASSSNSLIVPQVYEIYLNAPNVTTWAWTSATYERFYALEIFDWQGTNKLSTCSYWFYYCKSLRKVRMDASSPGSTATVKILTNFMNNNTAFNSTLDNIIFPEICTASSFLQNASAFNKPTPNFIVSGSTSSLMNAWTAFNSTINFDFSAMSASSSNFTNLTAFTGELVINCLALTATSLTLSQIYAMTGLRLLNMPSTLATISLTYTALGATELAILFEDLYDRTGLSSGAITITGSAGAAQLTTEQQEIATNKNWVITGV